MAELYKRGSIWWAWGYDRYGKRWQRTTKQRDKTAARTVAAKIEQELALDADSPKNEACTLLRAIEVMLDHAEAKGNSPSTIEFHTTKSKHLLRFFGETKKCTSFTLADTTEYTRVRRSEGAERRTVFYEVGRLIQALRRVSKLGLVKLNVDPSSLMPEELIGAYVPRERWLPQSEYRLLLAEFDPEITGRTHLEDRRDYIAIWCLTGMRKGELFRLRAEHCNFESRIVYVPGTKTKRSKGRPVPMAPAVETVLRRRIEALGPGKQNAPVFPYWGKVQRDLYAACLRIELRLNPGWVARGEDLANRSKKDRVRPPVPFDPVTCNDLRRTFASWLAQAGVPLYDAAKLMGHASIQMLERVYARLAPENLRTAIDRLPRAVAALAVTADVTAKPENSCQRHTPPVCEWRDKPHGITSQSSAFATFSCVGE